MIVHHRETVGQPSRDQVTFKFEIVSPGHASAFYTLTIAPFGRTAIIHFVDPHMSDIALADGDGVVITLKEAAR